MASAASNRRAVDGVVGDGGEPVARHGGEVTGKGRTLTADTPLARSVARVRLPSARQTRSRADWSDTEVNAVTVQPTDRP
nr:hypothetical protein [Streptomyces sp. SLBN-31]